MDQLRLAVDGNAEDLMSLAEKLQSLNDYGDEMSLEINRARHT